MVRNSKQQNDREDPQSRWSSGGDDSGQITRESGTNKPTLVMREEQCGKDGTTHGVSIRDRAEQDACQPKFFYEQGRLLGSQQ